MEYLGVGGNHTNDSPFKCAICTCIYYAIISALLRLI